MQPMNVPGPKAQEILDRDQKVISPSYPRVAPFVMERGKGTEIWDVDGNRFLDFTAGIAVAGTGHSHPKVVQAIQEQAEKFLHISSDFYHKNWVELGERLSEIAPFDEPALSFMSNSGTESVEAAIKLARNHTGRSLYYCLFWCFSWPDNGLDFSDRQQSGLPSGILSAVERCPPCPFPESVSSSFGVAGRRAIWSDCGPVY